MSTRTFIIILLAVVISIILTVTSNNNDFDSLNSSVNHETVAEGIEFLNEDAEYTVNYPDDAHETDDDHEHAIGDDDTSSTGTEETNSSANSYIPYTEAAAREAVERGVAVLFFHAPWCPTCRSLEKEIVSNLDKFPGKVTILKVNYDTESALKTKYGVVSQHTLVVVDDNLETAKKWRGGGIDEVLFQLDNTF